ncbi:MAG: FecR family protein [Rhodanobacter sp.]
MIMASQDEKLRQLIAEQAAEWHVAHQEGGLSPQQARDFMGWLRTSPIHVGEYLSVAGIARDLADAARESTASLEDILSEDDGSVRRLPPSGAVRAHAHRVAAERGAPARHAPKRPRFRWATGIAAVALLSVAMLAALHQFARRPGAASFSTQHGEVRSLRLPDRTVVQLDSDSSIAIDFDDGGRRVVVGRGRAYFKVAKDPVRPFSVRAGQSVIRDVGTAFAVYRREADTAITVEEGRVQVSRALPDRPVASLGAGEQVLVAASGQVKSRGPVDLQQALAWMQGNIVFDNEPVASVVSQFNRYNDEQIIVDDPSIAALPISGTFKARNVAAFVAFLGSMPDVSLDRRGERIVVRADRRTGAK